MSFFKLSKIKRKRITVVFTCVLIAVMGWFLLTMSSSYVYTVKTIMLYKNFPQNRAFHPLQSDTIDLKVRGTGWELLVEKLRVNPKSVDVDLSKLNNQDYIVFANQLDAINRSINSAQLVIGADPDTLYFNFTRSYQRKIPIRLQSDLAYKKQFGQSGEIQFKPTHVNVRGPLEILDSLKYWETDTLKLSKLDKRTVLNVKLKKNAVKNVMVFPTSAQVTLPVEEFTEKKLDISIKIQNNNAYQDIAIFPRKATITFLVPFSKYNEIDADYLEAAVDLNDWKYKKHDQLTVNITRMPKFCKIVDVFPAKVDFLIEK